MRQLFRFLVLSLTALWGVHAFDIPIFTFNPSNEGRVEESGISGNVARLLLERRMKSVDNAVLGLSDEETVKCLNKFGGKQQPLLGAAGGRESLHKSLVMLEGIDTHSLASIQRSSPSDLVVTSHSSGDLVVDELLASILETNSNTKTDTSLCTFHSENASAGQDAYQAARECLVRDPIIRDTPIFGKELLAHVDSVDSWVGTASSVSILRVRFKRDGHMDAFSVNHIMEVLKRLETAASGENLQITALLSPGTLKSQRPVQITHSRHNKKEEFLSNSFGRTPEQASIPSTLTPVCYTSNSTCVEATNNCSGHGSCYKKHSAKNGAVTSDCFACKCFETRTVGKDGRIQKMRWGGPACQKRDVSSPFFLIAGVTITVTVSVIVAVGMLYNTGQDELPSVIGAGVAPTKMQK